MKKVCIYCSASNGLDKSYHKEAQKMGELLAKNGYDLVYGGSDFGLMGEVAKAVKSGGGKVLGVMPKKLHEFVKHEGGNCDVFILTEEMRERKAKMDENADAVIALAGGFGTLEEISEILDHKIIGYNTKPVIFLNTNGFYDKLFEFFEHLINENFARQSVRELYYLAQTPEDVIEYLKNYTPNQIPKSVEDISVNK